MTPHTPYPDYAPIPSAAPDWDALRRVPVTDWQPRSALVVPRSRVPRSAVPCIDSHGHVGRWLNGGQWLFPDASELIDVMDASNLRATVNLDGFWGEELAANLEHYKRYSDRVFTFCWIDWKRIVEPGGVDALKREVKKSADAGARGIKVWKELGLKVHEADGSFVLPDDPRVIDLLGYAGELGLPILIHIADPRAYFAPADEHNERLDELIEDPDLWVGDSSVFPTFDRLIDALEALAVATPGTRYAAAHVGCAVEDLDRVERMLTAAPNLRVDIAGRIAELARQPRRFAALVARHPDRVVFGTDLYPMAPEKIEKYFHFLESDDEGYEYWPREPYPPHARGLMSSAALPLEHLERIYATNPADWLGI